MIEVSKAGKIVKEVKLKYKKGGHNMMRHARKLAGGVMGVHIIDAKGPALR